MSQPKLIFAGVGAFVLAVSVFAIGTRTRRPSLTGSAEPSATHAAIETVRLNPPSGSCDEIECPSLEFVDLTYQVFNRGHSPIVGLKIGTKCSCEEVGDPPEVIRSGESAPIRFRLRAPYAGRLQRTVSLVAEGASEPVALLDVSLRVKFDPPALLPPPKDLSFTFVAGGSSERELVLEAIEATREEHWVRGLQLDQAEGIELQSPTVEELPQPDPDLTRRRYRFTLVNQSLPVGRQTVIAAVQTRSGSPQVESPVIIQIDVADAVAIVPNPLVIKYAQGSPPVAKRVRVVNRTGGETAAQPIEYDQGLLKLVAATTKGGSMTAFDVAPVKSPESAVETRVVFRIGADQIRELAVRFEPWERP